VSPGNNDGDPGATDGITIDTRGLACPLPVLKVRKAMRAVAAGTKVVILATDPGAEEDIRAYCEASGCGFLSSDTPNAGLLRMVIQKS
jgi:tRNA 2-thiouridine synthesizing protein A